MPGVLWKRLGGLKWEELRRLGSANQNSGEGLSRMLKKTTYHNAPQYPKCHVTADSSTTPATEGPPLPREELGTGSDSESAPLTLLT